MSLKEFFFNISFLYRFIPVRFLMKLAGKNMLFPFYHFVDNNKSNFINHLYKPKTEQQFIDDLHFFVKHFTSISAKDLKIKKYSKGYYFMLSFDDGLSNFYNIVAPILRKEKIDAINFINSNFIDNKGLFYRYKVSLLVDYIMNNKISNQKQKEINKIFNLNVFNSNDFCEILLKTSIKDVKILNKVSNILEFSFPRFLNNKEPYLTYRQISELIDQGFLFGAHSKNHPRYSLIPLDEQILETIESIDVVANKFNLKDNYFSFPFSDDGVSKEFFNRIKDKKIVTFGTAGLKDENIDDHFQRIPMEYSKVYSAEVIIKGELIYYILKRFFGKHVVKRT